MYFAIPKSLLLSRTWGVVAAVGVMAGFTSNQALAQEFIAQEAIQTVAKASAEAKPPLTDSLALVTDYRFRGISQTLRSAAVHGGVELAPPQGWYLGTWLSNVSTHSYPQGQSLEHDISGGWRGDVAAGWQGDAGLLHYRYPGARLGAAGGGSQRFDMTEVYLGAAQGGFSAKGSVALTPYYGLRERTAGAAFATALAPAGSRQQAAVGAASTSI